MHCFEIRTANVDYFVGEDPLFGTKDPTKITMPPQETGIGSHLAKSWETAIRQALMPVTPQGNSSSVPAPARKKTYNDIFFRKSNYSKFTSVSQVF